MVRRAVGVGDRRPAPDPDRAGDQGLSQCPQAAKLRELRLRPERDRRPDEASSPSDFFERLDDPGNLSPLSFEAEIEADRGTAESLDEPRSRLDTPGRVEERAERAQPRLPAAPRRPDRHLRPDLQRRSATRGRTPRPSTRSPTTCSTSWPATSSTSRPRAQIDAELKDQGIDEKAPDSVFLADPQRWLDPLQVSSALALVSGGKATTSGTHGLALYQTTVKPGDVSLDPNSAATISGSGAAGGRRPGAEPGRFRGDATSAVNFQLTGGAQTISGDGPSRGSPPAAIQTASIPIRARARHRSGADARGDRRAGPGRADHRPTTARPTRSRSASRSVATLAAIAGDDAFDRGHARRVPGPGGHLLRGCPARRRSEAPRSMPRPRPPSTTRSAPWARARSTARWSRSRTRSRARCARPSTRLRSRALSVTIAGEHDHPIHNSLIAREQLPLERVEVVLSHPQASAQCARFIREQLPGAQVRAAPSTAEAVREVSSSSRAVGAPWERRPPREIYGCVVLREGVEDSARQRDPLRLDRAGGHQARGCRGPGARRSSSPSSAPTTPARWSRR